jgi:hypothetical protein
MQENENKIDNPHNSFKMHSIAFSIWFNRGKQRMQRLIAAFSTVPKTKLPIDPF